MQKIATRVFIAASVVFGVLGTFYWITISHDGEPDSNINQMLTVLLGITVSIILSSFALSVAGKYLIDND